ncbi:GNAT family N-acetyltransferase [Exilibacterium tricleocarpae]|uniref:GNAT family N-acetyltransferase n=1 Tax=Exilibacterium tricleocarpae TaxID=2591008 RepID=A0A545SNS7_9GAMM|nr:GNAT family N-acetyltransferase [Exilibacterium tricleocarpae]TQV66516.1 GNAT family N-acetyltransferase [Exilibacterium tricleocarpae]
MNPIFRTATAADKAALMDLMPRLADFDVPAHRNPKDLWRGDADMLAAHLAGTRDDCFCRLATDSNGQLLGFILVSLCEELLSHEPSAHVEALAVTRDAQGRGIGRQLLEDAERCAQERGALSMSLHVFGNNTRARGLYARQGYDEELIRCSKPLE